MLRCDGYRGERTLGTGWIDLRQMLFSGEEKLLVGVELKDSYGQQAALLHVRVLALQALRLAWWSAARHEHIGLVAHVAKLHPASMRRASLGGPLAAWVEMDIGVQSISARSHSLHAPSRAPCGAWTSLLPCPSRAPCGAWTSLLPCPSRAL